MNAEDSKSAFAVISAVSAFAIVDSLANLPLVNAQTSRNWYLGVAVSGVEWVMNRIELAEAQLVELGRTIQGSVDKGGNSLLNAFMAERCTLLHILRHPREYLEGEIINDRPLFGVQIEFKKAMGGFDELAIMWLDLMGDYIDVVSLPESERQKGSHRGLRPQPKLSPRRTRRTRRKI